MALNLLLKRSGTASKRPDGTSMALGELDINYNDLTGGLFYKDSSGNVVKVGPAEVGAAAPNSSPAGSAGNSLGEFWFDTGSNNLQIFNGSVFSDVLRSLAGDLTVNGSFDTPNDATIAGITVGTGGVASNIAIGDSALFSNVSGVANTAVGTAALGNNTSGTNNIAIGLNSLLQNTAGYYNVAVGGEALTSNSTGNYNTAVGASALLSSTSGIYNTAIGYNAGANIGSGDYNVIVGSYTGVGVPLSGSGSNHVVLSDGAGNVRLTTNANGALSFDGSDYGTANQVLISNGSGSAPTWSEPTTVTATATKPVSSGVSVDLLSFDGGVRMGTLTVMANVGSDIAWANITIAAETGVGYSVATTQAGSFGVFAIAAGGGGETVVNFTPSASLSNVVFTYKYTLSVGSQPTIL